MGFTDKYDLEEIAYGTTGWNAIVTSNMQKIDDHVWTRLEGTAGEIINQWDAVSIDTDGKFYKAQADGAKQPCWGLAVESAAANESVRIQRVGEVTNPAWSWTPGGRIYLDPSTPGELTQTKPATNIQMIGLTMTATKIFLVGNLIIEAES